ncbi:dihydrolipoyl dehydrogenase [Gottschalkiaceae bacterium SANA]|nr:dihydrolipoyl dehydrogenase [Gottschalkiaceae bacterium SANA]
MKHDLTVNKLPGHETKGKVMGIQKKAGDTINPGDLLFTIESGKGNMEFFSEFQGTLDALNVEEGQVVKKNEKIGQVTGEHVAGKKATKASAPAKKKTTKSTTGYSFGISKPAKKDLHADLVVVGGGPGGYVAAIRGAQAGLSVILIEEHKLGGTCLNYGCIPTKALASSVSVLEKIHESENFGFGVSDVAINMNRVIERKDEVVSTLVGGVAHLMESNQIEVIEGKAFSIDENMVGVKTKKLDAKITFEKLILAMGSTCFYLPIEGHEDPELLTSKELLELTEVPKSLTIIGGGVIGMEFAFIYRALGAEVNVVEFLPQILNLLDEDAADVIRESAEEKGIRLFEGHAACSIQTTLDGQKLVVVKLGDEKKYLTSEKVAMAVGRRANLNSMDLEKLGVDLNERKNGVAVDGFMRTSNPKVYAIGDLTNKLQLAHVASHQGIVAVDHIKGSEQEMRYDWVPSAIFTNPEVGHVGMTEKQALADGIEILVGKFPLAANGKALAMGEPAGFVKIIAEKTSKTIIGGTVVGVHGTDMIATITNLIVAQKSLEEAEHVIYAHPTTAESIHEAILASQGRAIHFG